MKAGKTDGLGMWYQGGYKLQVFSKQFCVISSHVWITWTCNVHHMGTQCTSHGHAMYITWAHNVHHMGITWISHDHNMDVACIHYMSRFVSWMSLAMTYIWSPSQHIEFTLPLGSAYIWGFCWCIAVFENNYHFTKLKRKGIMILFLYCLTKQACHVTQTQCRAVFFKDTSQIDRKHPS